VIQDVSRYAQVGVWEGTITAAGRTFEVTPDRWKGARDRSWGVRPVGEPEHPGIKVRGAQDGYGFRHDWLPHADWIELEGIGHCPQLDVPLETAQLILGFTS